MFSASNFYDLPNDSRFDENLCTFGRLSEQPNIYVPVACTWSKVGWTELNNILNYIAIPTRNGQYCKCAIVSGTGSYRMMCPYVKLSTDINRLYVHFYAADTTITSSSATVWPLFLS